VTENKLSEQQQCIDSLREELEKTKTSLFQVGGVNTVTSWFFFLKMNLKYLKNLIVSKLAKENQEVSL